MYTPLPVEHSSELAQSRILLVGQDVVALQFILYAAFVLGLIVMFQFFIAVNDLSYDVVF